MMTLYPPLESGETHRLQHVAEVRFPLQKEQDFRSSMYKKYQHGANVADETDTALSVTSVGLAASGIGLLSTIIAAPVAIVADCVWAARGRREIGRLEASSKSQDT